MLMTVEELKRYITTEEADQVLADRLSALELTIRKYTNNNFQARAFRSTGTIINDTIRLDSEMFIHVGDTIQITNTGINEGLYVVETVSGDTITVDDDFLIDEADVLITIIRYPKDVKLGAAMILDWQLRNHAMNSGDTSKAPVASETISRHSVSYVSDATEGDLSAEFGVPKKLVSFLNGYRKARF